jgi:adenosylcobinamide-GDP ribazoletransferase
LDDETAEPLTQRSLAVRFVETLLRLLRFFSRLPVPATRLERQPHALPDPKLSAYAMVPAAILIALPACLVLIVVAYAGFPFLVTAVSALLALAITTGGLHEDGLADTMDGFSGGSTPERALEIMRDPHIGAHGALAIALNLLLQAAALSAILGAKGVGAAVAALLVASALSRILCLSPLVLMAPARAEGRGVSFGRPSVMALIISLVIAIDLGLVAALLTSLTVFGWIIGSLGALAAVRVIVSIAGRKIGGHTGDICGACQQVGMAAMLVGFSLN